MLFNTPYFRVLNANTSSAPISIYTGKFLIKNREYGFKLQIDHFFIGIMQVLKFEFLKFRILDILNFLHVFFYVPHQKGGGNTFF